MAEIGDIAAANGYPLVPPSGEDGLVKWGYREINRTRDFLATAVPEGKTERRTGFGITTSINDPTGGDNGDIHFKVL